MPDVNVWLALASRRHAHTSRAARWMDSLSGTACFCRVTQAALLRLLTNPAVMGAEVLDASRAWSVYDQIRSDSRVEFVREPVGLESEWRRLTGGGPASPANWTGSYLLAFALAGHLQLVTFDSALARRDPSAVLL
ncbi:MAG: TA system VapC family ribonuclease toxin [Acidobacteriota bacterium]